MASKRYVYFVEGENERKLIQVLKTEFGWIENGKVFVHNVLMKLISPAQMRQFSPNTTVILVFDTDVNDINLEILHKNLNALKKQNHVCEVLTIPQVKNIEDELIRSTAIHDIRDLLHSKSKTEFKTDFNRADFQHLKLKMIEADFDIRKLWSVAPEGIYRSIRNDAAKIKCQQR